MNNIIIPLLVGLIFSPMAGLMVFFITYMEYSHHYTDKRIILKHSLEAGVFTFFVFILISLIIGLFLIKGF